MSFYGERILPHLIDWSCGLPRVTAQRRKVVDRLYLPGTPRFLGYHRIGIARPHRPAS